MESPFDNLRENGNGSGKFSILYLEPILDSYSQTYKHVLTFSDMPEGPISDMVRRISLPRLSPFQTTGVDSPFMNCTFILSRYRNGSGNCCRGKEWMGAEDIPSVFSYLVSNGYTIDTSLTKLLHKSEINFVKPLSGNRKMICMFSWKI
jgi:hypothetical protein